MPPGSRRWRFIECVKPCRRSSVRSEMLQEEQKQRVHWLAAHENLWKREKERRIYFRYIEVLANIVEGTTIIARPRNEGCNGSWQAPV